MKSFFLKATILTVLTVVAFGTTSISAAHAAIALPDLTIASQCSEAPATFRTWTVSNTTAAPIAFSWEVDATAQTGNLTVGANANVTFDTVTEGTNDLTVLVSGNPVASAVSNDNTCGDQNPPECGTELVTNGSFETPTLTNPQGWDAFPSGANNIGWKAEWVNPTPMAGKPTVANLEYQNMLTAQDGSQFTELDSDWDGIGSPALDDASVRIYQYLFTNPGSDYVVKVHTSPLPGTNASENQVIVSWNGVVQDTIVEDGSANTDTVWTEHSYTVSATSGTTKLQLQDGGTSDTFGSLLDNVSVVEKCDDNGGGGSGLSIAGKVYNDNSPKNFTFDSESEAGLSGWTVDLSTYVSESEKTPLTTTVSDANGDYLFSNVAAGCYVVTEEVMSNWEQTEPGTDSYEYLVALGGANCDFNPVVVTFTDKVLNFFVSTAQAAGNNVVVANNAIGLNFGNSSLGGNSGGGGGCTVNCGGGSGGGSTPVPPVVVIPTPPGQVLGDTTTTPSTPQVAGAVTELPRTGVPAWALLALFGAMAVVVAPKAIASVKRS